MEVRPSEIQQFQKLYRQKFDIDLDYDSAKLKLSILVNQALILSRSITNEHKTAVEALQVSRNENEDVNHGQVGPRSDS